MLFMATCATALHAMFERERNCGAMVLSLPGLVVRSVGRLVRWMEDGKMEYAERVNIQNQVNMRTSSLILVLDRSRISMLHIACGTTMHLLLFNTFQHKLCPHVPNHAHACMYCGIIRFEVHQTPRAHLHHILRHQCISELCYTLRAAMYEGMRCLRERV